MNALETVTDLSLDEAEVAVRAALAEEGFGVLTEIDVAATLKAKIDVEAADAKLVTTRALELDPSVSLLLPCNVVIEPTDDGRTRVSVIDPIQLLADERFTELADEATGRFQKALAALGPAPAG